MSKLYQIINKLTPKTKPDRIQLRSDAGHLLEALDQLRPFRCSVTLYQRHGMVPPSHRHWRPLQVFLSVRAIWRVQLGESKVPRFVRLLGRLRQQEQPTIPPFLGYEGAGSVPPLVQERHQLGGYHGSHPKKREPRACVRCHGFHTSVPWRFKLGWGKLSSVLFVRRHALRPCRNWWFSPSLHTCRDGAARTP